MDWLRVASCTGSALKFDFLGPSATFICANFDESDWFVYAKLPLQTQFRREMKIWTILREKNTTSFTLESGNAHHTNTISSVLAEFPLTYICFP